MSALIPALIELAIKRMRSGGGGGGGYRGGGGGGGGGYRGGYGRQPRPQQSPEEIANASAMKAASKEMIEDDGDMKEDWSAFTDYIKQATSFDPNMFRGIYSNPKGGGSRRVLENLTD